MATLELLYICLSAFVSVFAVLTVLALLMRLILAVFPDRGGDDAMVLAALTSVLQTIYPGTRVTNIEEEE